jgi:hypothetical protein
MPFPITIFNTSVDADRFETLDVTTTPVTSQNPISGARVLIVSNVDIYIDIGLEPDVSTSYGLVPAGTPIMYGVHNPHQDKVSIRAVSGTGVVTLYHI